MLFALRRLPYHTNTNLEALCHTKPPRRVDYLTHYGSRTQQFTLPNLGTEPRAEKPCDRLLALIFVEAYLLLFHLHSFSRATPPLVGMLELNKLTKDATACYIASR